MAKRADLREIWVNDISSVEVVKGELRVVLSCTRGGQSVDVLAVVTGVSNVPDMIAKVMNAMQSETARLAS